MSDVYTVIIAPEAVSEVTEIAAWWTEHRPAAPRLFQTELDRAVLKLAERPEVGPRVRVRGRPGLRVLTLQRTGYLVFYSTSSMSPRSRRSSFVSAAGTAGRFTGR